MRLPKSFTVTVLLLLIAAQVTVRADEVAVLRNGFSISHVRREAIGDMTRLYTRSGYVDVPTEQISSFEVEEAPVSQPEPQPQPPAARAEAADPIATPNVPLDLDQVVKEASSKRRIDPDFVNSVIKAESNFHTRAVSPKGARGLMQLMPGTAAKLGVTDVFDPRANVEGGTAYLSHLLDLYNNDPILALAAYNAGPQRVQQYHGVPPYRETRAYISRIVRDFNAKKTSQGVVAPQKPQTAGTQTASSTRATTQKRTAKKKTTTATASQAATRTKTQQATAAAPQTTPVN